MIQIPVSVGELFDKVTILRIKMMNMEDPEKIRKAEAEYLQLSPLLDKYITTEIDKLFGQLHTVNSHLWSVEDRLRLMERDKMFDMNFIDLARSVYHLNDQRFELKNKINQLTDSDIVEVKEYTDYK